MRLSKYQHKRTQCCLMSKAQWVGRRQTCTRGETLCSVITIRLRAPETLATACDPHRRCLVLTPAQTAQASGQIPTS